MKKKFKIIDACSGEKIKLGEGIMVTKLYILDENNKFLHRKIKKEGEKEYILHKGMKAFLKDLPAQQHGNYTVIQKKIDYYVNKANKGATQMNDVISKPGLYCRVCCTKLMVKNVCTVFCPNKKCGDTK